MTALERWRGVFRDADICPWPGPRPLGDEDDERMLAGRGADTAAILNDCLSHNLVVLTGESGVGKSSFLSHGLTPALRPKAMTSSPAATGATHLLGRVTHQQLIDTCARSWRLPWDLQRRPTVR